MLMIFLSGRSVLINRWVNLGIIREKEKEHAQIKSKYRRVFFPRYVAINNAGGIAGGLVQGRPTHKTQTTVIIIYNWIRLLMGYG